MAAAQTPRETGEVHSFKGGQTLIFRDFEYRRDKVIGNVQHWRCKVHGCPGRAKTDMTNPAPDVLSVKEHNHDPDEDKVAERRAKAELCERARNDRTASLTEVLIC